MSSGVKRTALVCKLQNSVALSPIPLQHTICRLPESLAATYRKFGHIGKLACRAIRARKTTAFHR